MLIILFRGNIEFEWGERVMRWSTSSQPFTAVLDIAYYIFMYSNKCVSDTLCVSVVRVSKLSLTLNGFINDL